MQERRSPKHPTGGPRPGAGHRFALAAVLLGGSLSALSPLPADTVFLKNGTQILDCKVTSETPTQVSVRTPVGTSPTTTSTRISSPPSVRET
jgi:hypothetical protein